MDITVKKEVQADIDIQALAKSFAEAGDDRQAEFINEVGAALDGWSGEFQCCHIAKLIDEHGKRFIYTLANFIKVQKFDDTSPHHDGLLNTYQE